MGRSEWPGRRPAGEIVQQWRLELRETFGREEGADRGQRGPTDLKRLATAQTPPSPPSDRVETRAKREHACDSDNGGATEVKGFLAHSGAARDQLITQTRCLPLN